MSDGGKGSRARPLSVTQEQYDNRWDYIFRREKSKPADVEDNTGVDKNEYQDVLSTEDCLVDKK
jgi:outer membrane protein assembly factor BamE (lipoprotein component of BamABCDE complex)